MAMKDQAYDFIDVSDRSGAVVFAKRLEQLLREVNPPATESDREAIEVVKFWQARLKFFGFPSMTVQEQVNFFKNDVQEALKNGWDIKERISRYFDLYSEATIEEVKKTFLNSLRENKSPLFEKAPTLTVGGILAQYQINLSDRKLKGLLPGAFDVLNFSNTNPNFRSLNEDEKDIVRSILALYNWLLSPILEPMPQKVLPKTFSAGPPKVSVPPPLPPAAAPQRLSPIPAPRPPAVEKVLPPPPRPQRMNISDERLATGDVRQKGPTYIEHRADKSGVAAGIPLPDSPVISTPPRPAPADIALSHSTLEDFARELQNEIKPVIKPIPQSPLPKPSSVEQTPLNKPLSVNEALIRAGREDEPDLSQMPPAKSDIEEKLKKAEDQPQNKF